MKNLTKMTLPPPLTLAACVDVLFCKVIPGSEQRLTYFLNSLLDTYLDSPITEIINSICVKDNDDFLSSDLSLKIHARTSLIQLVDINLQVKHESNCHKISVNETSYPYPNVLKKPTPFILHNKAFHINLLNFNLLQESTYYHTIHIQNTIDDFAPLETHYYELKKLDERELNHPKLVWLHLLKQMSNTFETDNIPEYISKDTMLMESFLIIRRAMETKNRAQIERSLQDLPLVANTSPTDQFIKREREIMARALFIKGVPYQEIIELTNIPIHELDLLALKQYQDYFLLHARSEETVE